MSPRGDGWPKLSETLLYPRALDTCQACGATAADLPGTDAKFEGHPLQRWLEHDANDRPTGTVVVLCPPCGRKIIEPHPRLYDRLEPNAPAPGAMPICVGCERERDLACTHPRLRRNGGTGLAMVQPKPDVVFATLSGKRGGRRCVQLVTYPSPVLACEGRPDILTIEDERRILDLRRAEQEAERRFKAETRGEFEVRRPVELGIELCPVDYPTG